ncbi:MAG: hypothetical protein HUU20_10575 [Pirellulales bacterium]|nr:hypothetical protein [Pirellulales bacterium]
MRGCAPGRGTSAAYGLSSSRYGVAMAGAQHRAMLARQAIESRLQALWKQAASDADRLAVAERSYRGGDLRTASRIYRSLALSQPKRAATEKARQRLAELGAESQKKLSQIEATLDLRQAAISPSDLMAAGPDQDGRIAQWRAQVESAFKQYDELADQYNDVPTAESEIRKHVRKQRSRPECATVLNEPKAKALWEIGQQHEADNHACCAYWVYREARDLAPAPSARLAEQRLAAMEQEPATVAAAEACRNLQECHKLYERAERLEPLRPDRARELYAQVVARAPGDSPVHQAARNRMESISPQLPP